MKTRAYQLFDDQARPLPDANVTKYMIFGQALLHGAAHIWIWRQGEQGLEVLLQRRAAHMATFPGKLDISAAGHIDFGEDPLTTAVRETSEEIGLDISADDLRLAFSQRTIIPLPVNDWTENEIRWVYTYQLRKDAVFTLEEAEVGETFWKPLAAIEQDVAMPEGKALYVPHSPAYFVMLFEALEAHAAGMLP